MILFRVLKKKKKKKKKIGNSYDYENGMKLIDGSYLSG